MLNRDGGLKADENWMSAETSWVLGVARDQKYLGVPVDHFHHHHILIIHNTVTARSKLATRLWHIVVLHGD